MRYASGPERPRTEAPRPVDLPVEGAESLKAAVIRVSLFYATSDPLG
jgi:hypothetical protein